MIQHLLRHSQPETVILSLLSIAMGTLATSVDAATLRVPADHSSIQQAIAAATSGDVILIAPGTYYENVQLLGKQLTLRGESGAAVTVVDGQQLGGVILMDGGGLIEGLTIRNGLALRGAGVLVTASTPATIRDCVIERNQALPFDQGLGGGIYLSTSTAGCLIEGNVIRNNYAGDSGGGIRDRAVAFPANIIRANRIEANGCHVAGGGIRAGVTEVTGNLVVRNWSDSFGAGIMGGGAAIRNNTVIANYNNNGFLHGAGIHVTTELTTIENNIVAFNRGLIGLGSGAGIRAPGAVGCNDAFGNDGPDYYLADTTGLGNLSQDPLFCDATTDDYSLHVDSPCAASQSPTCGLIGAFPVGCGVTGVVRASWGHIKVLYRE